MNDLKSYDQIRAMIDEVKKEVALHHSNLLCVGKNQQVQQELEESMRLLEKAANLLHWTLVYCID